MRALILGSVLLSGSAFGAGFDDIDTPMTTTFNFHWSTYTPGSTTFTFSEPTVLVGGNVCNQFAADTGTNWCFNGTFSTGNAGIGPYQTRLFRNNCVTTTSYTLFPLTERQTERCDVEQRLSLTYEYTVPVANPAQYEGFAEVGQASRTRSRELNCTFIPLACNPDPFSPWSPYGYTQTIPPGRFSGELSGPGSGVFCESPLTCSAP